MVTLEKSIYVLREMNTGRRDDLRLCDVRCGLLVCILYLVAMLSVPVHSLQALIFFAVCPAVAAAIAGIEFGKVLVRSLAVLPLVALIGAFNPWFHRDVAFEVGGVAVSMGWLEFAAIILRGLLSVQALLVLTEAYGFAGICRGMRRLGVPGFLTTQLLFVFRYLDVLLTEALTMRRAREARGYMKKSMSLRMWSTMTGQLFIRTVHRAQRVHRSMLARGFHGEMPVYGDGSMRWRMSDTIVLVVWSAVFAVLRFVNLGALFNF